METVVAAAGVRALALARMNVGVREWPAGSNRNPFGAWFGEDGVPWCAIFVSYCFLEGAGVVLGRGIHALPRAGSRPWSTSRSGSVSAVSGWAGRSRSGATWRFSTGTAACPTMSESSTGAWQEVGSRASKGTRRSATTRTAGR